MRWWIPIGGIVLLVNLAWSSQAETVTLLQVKGAIGPATATYIVRSLKQAANDKAECLILELDTPGGLLDSTKEIVQAFYTAPLPTVVYVAPAGTGASSAGCFITLAANVAAMAKQAETERERLD